MQNPKRQGRPRNKKTTYVLQVTCEKIPDMNEAEFLSEVRKRINLPMQHLDGTESKPITMDGSFPRVSVLKRIEEFIK